MAGSSCRSRWEAYLRAFRNELTAIDGPALIKEFKEQAAECPLG
jgi:hypothetical protein